MFDDAHLREILQGLADFQSRIHTMSVQLDALAKAVDAAVAKLNSPAPNAGFTQADMDAAVAKAIEVDAAANQAKIDAMTTELTAAHSTAPGA